MRNYFFDRRYFEQALESVAEEFGASAPTVADWCDRLASAKDCDVSLADLALLWRLYDESVHPNLAANLVFHGMSYSGIETEGQIGF